MFGRSAPASAVFLKIRNQCKCVLKYHLCIEANPHKNGEYFLLQKLRNEIKTFADVGANKGLYTDEVLRVCQISKGILFEPLQKCFSELNEKFEKFSNIRVINTALADYVGESKFFYESEYDQCASLVPKESNSYSVRVDTLDNQQITHLDLLKIDAEGYDLNVLRGAENLLKSHSIRFIQFEYGDPWPYAGNTLYKALEYLGQLGYEVYRIDAGGLHTHDYAKYGEYYTYSNFFAFPIEENSFIQTLGIIHKG